MKRITRREALLAGTGALMAVGCAPRNQPDSAKEGLAAFDVIDTHTHFYDPTRPLGVPWPAKNEALLYRRVMPADFRKAVEGCRVVGTVVVEASGWLEDNQWLLDLAANDPFILGVVGNLDLAKEGFRSSLDRFRKNPLFKGIRVIGGDLRRNFGLDLLHEEFKYLAQCGLTLDVLGGTDIYPVVGELAMKVPDLKIVIDHLPLDFEKNQQQADRALADLAECGNVHGKVSAVVRKSRADGTVITHPEFYRVRLDELWAMFGEGRLFYGSNWPVCEKIAGYPVVQGVIEQYVRQRGGKAGRAFFVENAVRFYGLKPPGR